MPEEQKFNPTKYKNDFQKQKYDRLIVNVPKGKGDIIKKYAKEKGLSLNSYVTDLIDFDMNSYKMIGDTTLQPFPKQSQSHSHIVAYIDLLGTKNMIKKGDKEHFSFFSSVLHNTEKLCNPSTGVLNDIIHQNPEKASILNEIKYKVFSDNILFAIEYSKDSPSSLLENTHVMIAMLIQLQQTFISTNNLQLLRGGLCIGELYFDDILVYGSGLLKAVELENLIANYPRIVIDKEFYKLLVDYDKNFTYNCSMFLFDFDDEIFVNYLKNFSLLEAQSLQSKLINKIQQETSVKVLQKYNWLKNYIQNYVLNPSYVPVEKAAYDAEGTKGEFSTPEEETT